MRERLLKNEDGAMSVIVSLCFTIILIICAFVIDIGNVAIKKAEFQNAVDAAALAAAKELPDTEKAREAAHKYIELNGFEPSDIELKFLESDTVVRIVGLKKLYYKFARIIGLNEAVISKTAAGTKGSIGEAFNYTVFSGSKSTELNMNGSEFNVTGSVQGSIHTNNNFRMNAAFADVTGVCKASGRIMIHGGDINVDNRVENAPYVSMPRFYQSLIDDAVKYGNAYYTDKSYNQSVINIDKPIFIDGDVTFSGSGFNGTGCIIASGDITFNGSSINSSVGNSVCFYSIGGNITINGSKSEIDGILYAPEGSININASSITVHGRIIGNEIAVNTSSFNIISSDTDLKSIDTTGKLKLIE